jgi:hypothetical protein
MSICTIDLGALTLESSASDLELTMFSAATFTPLAPANDEHTGLISLDRLTATPADKPLVRASRSLRYAINLKTCEIDRRQVQIMLRSFADCLKNAQVFAACINSLSWPFRMLTLTAVESN